MKLELKNRAVKLRKDGFSYNEILKRVLVAKSTLSLWLRSVDLSEAQKQKLTQKKRAGIMKGGQARRANRVKSTEDIVQLSLREIKKIGLDKNSLFLVGVALYWAEGAKQKEHNVSQPVCFANSDPQMLLIFLLWLDTICNIKKESLVFSLYIHLTADIETSVNFWESVLNINKSKIRVVLKKNEIKSFRKNKGSSYNGLIRITVPKSTNLNRKINGWIKGIIENCPVV